MLHSRTPELFHLAQLKLCTVSPASSHFPFPWDLDSHHPTLLLSLFQILQEKRNYTVFVFLWLAYFTVIISSSSIHVVNDRIVFILKTE